MSEISGEVVGLLHYLLPGFLAAWVFYGLTSHKKPTHFERVVQALIFTLIVQALIPAIKWLSLFVGQRYSLGVWTPHAETATSVVLALALGFAIAVGVNKDWLAVLRKFGLTRRTSYPSEWYCVLSQKITYVVLQLNDGRRLYGWPKEWPCYPGQGHFYIMDACWLLDDDDHGIEDSSSRSVGEDDGEQHRNRRPPTIELRDLDGLLVNCSDVKWVEFMGAKEASNDQRDSRNKRVKPAAGPQSATGREQQSTADL